MGDLENPFFQFSTLPPIDTDSDDNNDEMRDDDTGDAKQTHVAVKVHVPQTYESGEQIFRRNQARKKLLAVLALQVQLYSTVDILSLTLLKFLYHRWVNTTFCASYPGKEVLI